MMSARLAILCPGQGAQHPGMFAWPRADRHAAARIDSWRLSSLLGTPLESALDDPARLFSNRVAQPIVTAAILAAWLVVEKMVPTPDLVAGYSIGEVAAYAVAGALPIEDAIDLAAERAALMDNCLLHEPHQGLLAITGAHRSSLQTALRQHDLHIAIETAEDSVIVGGTRDALARFAEWLEIPGARVQALPIEVASHTPLMQGAVAPFAQILAASRMADPAVPVLAGISAERIVRRETAQSTLARQIAEKIEWGACMDACAERGIEVALELGPGCALSRMLHARHPQIECRSVANFQSIGGLARWLERRLG